MKRKLDSIYNTAYKAGRKVVKTAYDTLRNPVAQQWMINKANSFMKDQIRKKTGKMLASWVDKATRKRGIKGSSRSKKGKISYNVHGKYRGRFNLKPYNDSFVTFNKRGIVKTNEVTGTESDVDAVYVMSQTFDPVGLSQDIWAAILRRLFEKAGFVITGIQDPISDSGILSSPNTTQHTVNVYTKNRGTGTITSAATLALWNGTSGFKSIYDMTYGDASFTLRNLMNALMVGYSGGNDNSLNELWSVQLNFVNTSGDIKVLCQMAFDEMQLSIKVRGELKVQNRTKAADGSTDGQDVNNNPLQGFLYYFRGVPRGRGYEGFDKLEYMTCTNDTKSVGAATLIKGSSTEGKEPPSGKSFYNCTRFSKIRLEPGEIKRAPLKYYKSMPLLMFLQKVKLQYSSATYNYSSKYSAFPLVMVGLEDVINVNSAESISVAFEYQRTVGVMISEKKKRYCKTLFLQDTAINE